MNRRKNKGYIKWPAPGQRFNAHNYFKPYFVVPNILARSGLLTLAELLVWGLLAQFAGKNGACFPSYKKIADELSISRKTAVRAVNGLIAKKFLEREHRGGRTSHFFFLWHPLFDQEERPGANLTRVKSDPTPERPGTCSHPDPAPGPNLTHEKHRNENKQQQGRGGLSERQKKYIELKMAALVQAGKIKSPQRYRAKMEKLAYNDELDMSDCEEVCMENIPPKELMGPFNDLHVALKQGLVGKEVLLEHIKNRKSLKVFSNSLSYKTLEEVFPYFFPGQ